MLVIARRPATPLRVRAWTLGVFTSLSCLLAIACAQREQQATQIIVVVAVDEAVAREVSLVRAKLYPTDAEDGATPFQSLPFYLSPSGSRGRLEFPFSFGIAKGASERFLLVIEGYTSDHPEAVIEQKAIVSFRSGQALLLRMFLSYACYELTDPCSGLNQTCKTGACDVVDEPALEPITPGDELDDGAGDLAVPGDASDSGAVDNSVDSVVGAGQPCAESQEGARACDDQASRTVLRCSGRVWTPVDTCSETERCDPRTRPEQDACVSCLGKVKLDDGVCDGPD